MKKDKKTVSLSKDANNELDDFFNILIDSIIMNIPLMIMIIWVVYCSGRTIEFLQYIKQDTKKDTQDITAIHTSDIAPTTEKHDYSDDPLYVMVY